MCNLSKGKNLISMGWSAEQAMEALKIAESEQIQYVDGLKTKTDFLIEFQPYSWNKFN